MCLIADSGVAISTPARSHTFMEIDHEIYLLPFSSLPLIQEGLLLGSSKYVHKVLVISLVKLAQEKVWSGELTIPT